MAEETTSPIIDFAVLAVGHVGELFNEIQPDVAAVHLNSPQQCEARGRLVAQFGEEPVCEFEKFQLGLLRESFACRFIDGHRGARRPTRPLETAIAVGFDRMVREMRRPRMAMFNDKGDVVGSEPADPAKP